jgi:hypothetical protein
MVAISLALEVLYPAAISLSDFIVTDSGSGPAITYWNEAALGPKPTPEQLAAVTPEQVNAARLAKLRDAAKQFQDDQQAQNVALRVTVKLLVDELNILRQWITEFKAATAAASSLANLKTGVAALPNVPQRTYTQAKTAINNLIDGE